MAKKTLEVWNKIDLLDDLSILEKQENEILMSCLTTEGYDDFQEKLTELCNEVMGKTYRKLTYPCQEHDKRIRWLY